MLLLRSSDYLILGLCSAFEMHTAIKKNKLKILMPSQEWNEFEKELTKYQIEDKLLAGMAAVWQVSMPQIEPFVVQN